ncbi:AraC family transcriptional regulator [Nocardia pseudobrasiliensis]|uniref:AraC family transcriptional regulator n=1 Tax=Nocardia pseudobrasiliensis TaxID=45979 RepID=A0A370IF20_9NOCA|nr:AraC family transcriptional regulator [Nocardia pseudobrasiliensis]RDI68054.1 AraC family transcriptional regulator [Nocardia pseudobrasiliensis]
MDLFDPQFSAAVIPPTILLHLRRLAVERGFDTELWFGGTGVVPEQLDAPETRVSFRQADTVLRRALRALPDGPWGVEVGVKNATVRFGLLGFAMRSCRNGGEAFGLGVQLHRSIGSLLDFEFDRGPESSTLRILERIPDPETVRFLTEEAMFTALIAARSVLEDDVCPQRVRVAYPEPSYSEEYRRYFRCPIDFDCGVTELSFDSRLLDRPIRTCNEANLNASLDAFKRMSEAIPDRSDIVASVEAILGENLRRVITMAEVADRLFVTERTLRRQLTAAGERFSDIRDRVRQRRALFLVRETNMTIAQIASQTGYSDAREFRRAYVRWNGEPPSETRRTSGVIGDDWERVAS